MASSRHSKATKQALQDNEQPGSSYSAPTKWSKKPPTASRASKFSAARAKEELRLHQAIERSIQKALKEASVKEQDQPAQAMAPASTPPGVTPAPQASSPALSPDGDPSPLMEQRGDNEALFGPQSELSPPRAHSPEPQAAPAVASTLQGSGADRPGPLISPDLAVFIQQVIQKGITGLGPGYL